MAAAASGLSRIPVVGALFGQKSRTSRRSEVIVLLTPTIVRNSQESRNLTDEYSKRFRAMEPLNQPRAKSKGLRPGCARHPQRPEQRQGQSPATATATATATAKAGLLRDGGAVWGGRTRRKPSLGARWRHPWRQQSCHPPTHL
jgi:Flp pilus assembly secretin CpaC